jgi:hypothetical protein
MVGTDVGAGIEEWGSQEIDLECINYAGVEPCKKWRVFIKVACCAEKTLERSTKCSKNVMGSSCAKHAN